MIERSIVRRYAEGVWELAEQRGVVDEVLHELQVLQVAVNTDQRLLELLRHPSIAADEKADLLLRLIGARPTSVIQGFVNVAIAHKRPQVLLSAADAFRRVADEARGVVRAHVDVAWHPDQGQIERLQNALSRLLDQPVVVEIHEARQLLAGARVRLPGKVIEGTIDGHIEAMVEHIAGLDGSGG